MLALLMLVALVLGLAACGGSDSNETASARGSDADAAPVTGGTLKVTFQGEAGAQHAPLLATEVPSAANGGISAAGKTYTFHIRKA